VIVGNITNHKSLLYFFNITVKPAKLFLQVEHTIDNCVVMNLKTGNSNIEKIEE
jgi:hypothetical protein